MKDHINQIKQHQLIKILEGSYQLVENLMREKDFERDEQHFGAVQRIHHVLTHLIIIYKNTDPLMVSPSKLDSFVNQNTNPRFTQLPTILENYLKDKNINYLKNANTIIDRTINFFSYFIYPKTGREMAGLRASLEKYHSLVEKYIRSVQEKIEIFEQTTNEVGATLDSEIGTIKQRIFEFEDEMNQEQERINNLFNDQIEEIKNAYNEKYSNIKTEAENFINQISAELEELKESYQTNLEKHIEEVQGIVGALAERSISYGFQKIADDEKKAKERWNNISLIALVCLVVYALTMTVLSFVFEFTWGTLILRALGGFVAFSALIGFCTRQANIHAKVERYSRKMELELASLSPYFAGYDKEEIFEVKKDLAKRYFGNDDLILLSNQKSGKNEDLRMALENIKNEKS